MSKKESGDSNSWVVTRGKRSGVSAFYGHNTRKPLNHTFIQMNGTISTRVFVYGTLKPGGFYHNRFCGPFKFDSVEAYTLGKLFDFPQLGYPGALEDENSRIKGILLRFYNPESAVLRKLDYLEGYDPHQAPEKNEYYRKQVPIFRTAISAKPSESAWCYFMDTRTISKLGGIYIPDGFWSLRNPPI